MSSDSETPDKKNGKAREEPLVPVKADSEGKASERQVRRVAELFGLLSAIAVGAIPVFWWRLSLGAPYFLTVAVNLVLLGVIRKPNLLNIGRRKIGFLDLITLLVAVNSILLVHLYTGLAQSAGLALLLGGAASYWLSNRLRLLLLAASFPVWLLMNFWFGPSSAWLFLAAGGFGATLLRFREQSEEVQLTKVKRESEELKTKATRLGENEERFSRALEGGGIGLWDWNLKTDRIYFSAPAGALLDLGDFEGEVDSQEWFGRVAGEDLPFLLSAVDDHLNRRFPSFHADFRIRRSDGSEHWLLSRGIATLDQDKQPLRMTGMLLDITERKRAEQMMVERAAQDVLTGLANRDVFLKRLFETLNHLHEDPSLKFAVLLIDLDHFKVINDSLGHTKGDQILISVALRLAACFREDDFVARLGGDEFAILIEGLANDSGATRAAERVQAELSYPFRLGERDVFTSAGIGVVVGTEQYQDPEEILRDADTALYRAKAMGKGKTQLFVKEMHKAAVDRLDIESDLHRAVDRREFVAYFQPVVSMKTGQIASFEALVRWRHPRLKLLSPETFLPAAQETAQIVQIDRLMLSEVCRFFKEMQDRFQSDPPLTVSVNLSATCFSQPDLSVNLVEILSGTGLQPGQLRLEIKESDLAKGGERLLSNLDALRGMGVRLDLDQFGSGSASLGHLHGLKFDRAKLDRSLVALLKKPDERNQVLESMIKLAHDLGMNVVAVGVEIREQILQLRSLECDFVQGYYIFSPMEGGAIERLLARETELDCRIDLLSSPQKDDRLAL